DCARRASSLYFSLTTCSIFDPLMALLLAAHSDNFVALHCLAARATRRVKESKDCLQGRGIRRVPQKCALALSPHEALILQFFEMMGERRIRNFKFVLDFVHDEAFRMSREEKLHDAQPRFGSEGREHVGILCYLVEIDVFCTTHSISIIVEI